MKNSKKNNLCTYEAALEERKELIAKVASTLEQHDTRMLTAVFKFETNPTPKTRYTTLERWWPGKFCELVQHAAIFMAGLHRDLIPVEESIRGSSSTSCYCVYRESKDTIHFTFITYPKPDSSASGVSGGPSISPETSSSPAS